MSMFDVNAIFQAAHQAFNNTQVTQYTSIDEAVKAYEEAFLALEQRSAVRANAAAEAFNESARELIRN